jgi:hypothetical protein
MIKQEPRKSNFMKAITMVCAVMAVGCYGLGEIGATVAITTAGVMSFIAGVWLEGKEE